MPNLAILLFILTGAALAPFSLQAQTPIPAAPQISAKGFLLLDPNCGLVLASKI
jgi:hypothetical protein